MDKAQNDHAKRTIVGGRPRKRGLGRAGIPRGIEVLIKKASLDPAFCRNLLEQRAAAACEIKLELTPAETAILDSVPKAQLQAMIDHTKIPDAQRRVFLGQLGAAMLSAVVASCTPPTTVVEGIRPEEAGEATSTPKATLVTRVIEVEKGIRPDDLTRLAQPSPTLTPKAPPTPKATSTPETVSTPTPVATDSQSAPGEKPTGQVVRGIRPDRP